jgi:hypothetical protein
VLAQPKVQNGLTAMLAGYENHYGEHAGRHVRYQCILAAVQYHAGLRERAKATLAKISDDQLNVAVAKDFRVNYDAIRLGLSVGADGEVVTSNAEFEQF